MKQLFILETLCFKGTSLIFWKWIHFLCFHFAMHDTVGSENSLGNLLLFLWLPDMTTISELSLSGKSRPTPAVSMESFLSPEYQTHRIKKKKQNNYTLRWQCWCEWELAEPSEYLQQTLQNLIPRREQQSQVFAWAPLKNSMASY